MPAKFAASRRRRCGFAKPRRWASCAASCPRPTSIASERSGRLRARRRAHGRRSARSTSLAHALICGLIRDRSDAFRVTTRDMVPALVRSWAGLHSYRIGLRVHTGVPHGLVRARACLFVARVAYAAAFLRPLPVGLPERRVRLRPCRPRRAVRKPALRDTAATPLLGAFIGGAVGLAHRPRRSTPACSGPTAATGASSSSTASC